MLSILRSLYGLMRSFYEVLGYAWHSLRDVIRFFYRMIRALWLLVDSMPAWVLPFAAMSLGLGIWFFILNRR